MISVRDLTIIAGQFRLQRVSFQIPVASYGILMGRTGSGKTTILEAVCGLRPVSAGKILLAGVDVTKRKPAERGIGFVPQEGALFPTMSVAAQLAFALTIRHWSRKQITERVSEVAEMLDIGYLLERSVQGLSGGERQRVALGRALAFRPAVLCLDEPLSALDEDTRDGMCDLLKSITQQTGVTTLHITHSEIEAKRLGDVRLRIEDGVVQQF